MFERHVEQIERSLGQDLGRLVPLQALTDRLNPLHLVAGRKQAMRGLRGPLLSPITAMLRPRPIAFALAGLGAAAMVLARRKTSLPSIDEPGGTMAGTRFDALTRWEDEGGPPAPVPVDPDREWLDEAQGLRHRAQILLDRLDDGTRRGLAPAAQSAKQRADILAALTDDTRQALSRGLNGLTDAARDQTIAARERILHARVSLAKNSRQTVQSHPFASVAVALMAGAAMACLLSRSRTE